jgi:hypothetical protein
MTKTTAIAGLVTIVVIVLGGVRWLMRHAAPRGYSLNDPDADKSNTYTTAGAPDDHQSHHG